MILDNSPSSGSEFGLSFWSKFSGQGCPKREYLTSLLGPRDTQVEAENDDSSNEALDVGSCFHKLLEHYYEAKPGAGGASPNHMPPIDPSHPAMQEAVRLFAADEVIKGQRSLGYKHRFPADEFGPVGSVRTEFPLSYGQWPADADPAVFTATKEALAKFGVPIITGKIDLAAVNVDTATIARLSAEPRFLPLAEPGVYLLDHKTMRAKPAANGGDVALRNRFQFALYQALWDLLYANQYGKCQGFIVNCIVKHKVLTDGSFFSLLVPPPSEEQLIPLRNYLSKCYQNMLTKGSTYANEESCFNYNRVCGHYTSGACKRY